jgi:hypothetical protein
MSRLFLRDLNAADALGMQIENDEETARDDDDFEARQIAIAAQEWFNPLTKEAAAFPLTLDIPADLADIIAAAVENVDETGPDVFDDYTPGDAAII